MLSRKWMNFDLISTILSALCSKCNPVELTMLEISFTNLDIKYVQIYMLSTVVQVFNVYLYENETVRM